jgi:hypothetical protein
LRNVSEQQEEGVSRRKEQTTAEEAGAGCATWKKIFVSSVVLLN